MQGALQLQALAAGLWATGLYVLGRRLAAGRLAALAFTGLGVSSAAFMFWFSVAETYGLGSLTILAVLLVAVGQANQPPSGRGLFAANALSLSMTVTNWMAGLALTIACVPWRKAIRIALGAVAFVAVLALIQKWIIPTSKLFFLGSREELMYMGRQESGGVIEKLKVLLLYGFAMPQIDFKATGLNSLPLLSVQFARLGSSTVYALPALLCWTCLLSLGVWGALRTKAHVLLVRTIALTALGQIVLHLIYGEETFLYVLHLMPVMVALAMLSMLTPCRIIAPWLAVAAMVFSLANNTAVFSTASEAVSATVRQPEK